MTDTAASELKQFLMLAAEWIKQDGQNVYLAHLHGGLIE